MRRLAATLLSCAIAAAASADEGPLATTEARFLEFLDAANAVDYINSGFVTEYEGRDLAAWDAKKIAAYGELTAGIAALDEEKLPAAEKAALAAIRITLADWGNPSPAVANSPDQLKCADRERKDLDYDGLREVLAGCYREIGNKLQFEGGTVDRGSALGMLYDIEEPARRKALFDAFQPLWLALNGRDEPDSPYRRLIRLSAAEEATNGSGVAAAARAIGVTVPEVERWLVQVLEAWRDASPKEFVEPWDWRHSVGEGGRVLVNAVTGDNILAIDHRFYMDLGADLQALGVVYDIRNRPDKSPVAYTDFLDRGRYVDGKWRPTVARVVGRYEDGGLGGLNELVHENGHAVHISAIRNRPAFTDWTDTLFTEAFADVPSWSVYEPEWQRKYLGAEAPLGPSLRTLFGGVIMDIAWSLFEIRMLRDPDSDPNIVWTAITEHYLRITPHTEVPWWAVRVQLVSRPGYMINYGLGALLTAEMRQATAQAIGGFDAGNPRWYAWTSDKLLRYGSEKTALTLMKELLGRPPSVEALLAQIRRIH